MINLFKLYKMNFFRVELKIISVVLAPKKKIGYILVGCSKWLEWGVIISNWDRESTYLHFKKKSTTLKRQSKLWFQIEMAHILMSPYILLCVWYYSRRQFSVKENNLEVLIMSYFWLELRRQIRWLGLRSSPDIICLGEQL